MRLGERIGNLAVGYDADVVVLDLNSRPLIRQRNARAGDLWEALFVQMMLADERVCATYVGGGKVYARPAPSHERLGKPRAA